MTEPRHLPPDMLSVATGSSEPIYKQLMAQLGRLIAAGQVRSGDELPSVREVASALGVNPMTVSKTYSLLEAQGLLARRRGMGMVVTVQTPQAASLEARLELVRPGLARIAAEARQLELPPAAVIALLRTLMKGSLP